MIVLIEFILFAIWSGVFFYIQLPVLRFGFVDVAIYLIVTGAGLSLINILSMGIKRKQRGSAGYKMAAGFGIILMLCAVIYGFILPLSIHPLLRSREYRDLIGEIKEGDYKKDIPPVDRSMIRVVDQSMVMRIGDKLLGEDVNLGTQSELGLFNIQLINGKLYWVAPLLHNGFWKWFINSGKGTNGFVIVSATNPEDKKLVRVIDGKPVKIKYQPYAYFNQNLRRHVYFSGFYNVGTTDYSFEVDDNGKPYWVISKYTKKIGGFAGEEVTGVVVVDPETGKCESYGIEDCPAWVDRIQPEWIVERQLNDNGRFVNGFWNTLLSKKDIRQTSTQMVLTYTDDGRGYWYTGLTSVGTDESNIGFVLVDTRTKSAKIFRLPGMATEESAMSSAEGAVQQYGYDATFPVLYNVGGVPVYISSLKDKEGLVKKYGFVSALNYQTVGVGDTLEDGYRAFLRLINVSSKSSLDSKDIYKVKGGISRIGFDVRNGNSNYYIQIAGYNDIFIADITASSKLPLLKVGDNISIEAENASSVEKSVMKIE